MADVKDSTAQDAVFRVRQVAARVAVSLPFRILVAIAILWFQVGMMKRLAHDRFGWKFDESPGDPPTLHNVHDPVPSHWDRLIVSRWDAQHYEALGLRGYTTCKDKSQLGSGEYPDDDQSCELNFYPTYGFIGGAVMRLTHWPIDYSLYYVSLAASFVLILLWTGREMLDGLGVANAYLALLLMALFDTSFALVTVQTEPCLMALTLGAFVCLRKRWLLAGAVLAGAASAIRVTGVATGFAYCAALLFLTLRESPRPSWRWAWRGLLMAVSGWGILALMAYFAHRFGDPLIYAHSHERAFHHKAGISKIFFPDGRLLMQSIWAEPHDGLILAAGLLWFGLGHRKGLSGFATDARAYWYVLFFAIVAISMVGSVEIAYAGNTRYMLCALPIFFAMAATMRRKPVVLALWLFMSAAHYYHGSMCFYIGQNSPSRLKQCSFARSMRSEELQDAKQAPWKPGSPAPED
jgi:hypothetical protein